MVQRALERDSAIVLLAIGVAASVVGYFGFEAGERLDPGKAPARTHAPTHLLEEPEAAAFAPGSLKARFDWLDRRMGIALTWDPLPYKVRIYRAPSGTSRYVEQDGRLALLFDTEVAPGRAYTYVICARAMQDQEYCSAPISFELPDGNRR